MQVRWMGTGALALSLVLALGCGGIFSGKADACNALVGVINPAAVEFDRLSALPLTDTDSAVAALGELAALSRRVAEQVSALELPQEALRLQADRYSEMCQRLAATADEMAAVLQEIDALDAAMQAHSAALQQEAQGFTTTCSGTGDAAQCMTVIRQLPADLGNPEALRRYRDSVTEVRLSKPAAQDALVRFQAELGRLAETLEAAQALQARLERGQAELEAITSQEDPIVDAINAFCQA